MTTEISKNLVCILMRSGIEIWVEQDKVENIIELMQEKSVFRVGGQVINTADISGIFDAKTMEDNTRRKNGQWKDGFGNWRDKGDRVCKCGTVIPLGKTCGKCRI